MDFRHGDVLIRKIEAIPTDAVEAKADKRGLVLAEGEITGHHHRITDVSKGQLLISPDEAREMKMWLRLDAPAELTHEEHETLTLPAGDYEVIKQSEYEPEGLRNVAD